VFSSLAHGSNMVESPFITSNRWTGRIASTQNFRFISRSATMGAILKRGALHVMQTTTRGSAWGRLARAAERNSGKEHVRTCQKEWRHNHLESRRERLAVSWVSKAEKHTTPARLKLLLHSAACLHLLPRLGESAALVKQGIFFA
jgi:hypothetical protein